MLPYRAKRESSKLLPYRFSAVIRSDIKQLEKLDNWHALLAILEDYLVIVSAVLISLKISWFCYPLTALLIGSRQRGLANLLHAASHGTLARNRVWNFVAGTFLSGYLVFQQFIIYRYTHVLNHHGFFGDDQRDPDYRFNLNLGMYQSRNLTSFWRKYILLPLVGLRLPQYLCYVVCERLLPKKLPTNFKSDLPRWLDQLFF